MKKIWRKDGGDDYICELRGEKKPTQNCLPRAMEDWESPVQHKEQNRTEKGKKKECLKISNFVKRGQKQ